MASVSSTGSAFPMIQNRVYKGSIDEDEFDDDQFPLPPPPSSSIPSRHRFPMSPSYENSREEFPDEPLHEYEDMNRLAAQVKLHGRTQSQRPRKKVNDVYERVPRTDGQLSFRKSGRSHKNSGSSDSCESGDSTRERAQIFWRFLAIMAVVLALVALIGSLLVLLGVVAPSCTCKREVLPENAKIVAEPPPNEYVLQALKDLETNITVLHSMVGERDATIRELKANNQQQQDQIKKLQERSIVVASGTEGPRYNLSDLRGPQGLDGAQGAKGDVGPQGPRGPRGLQGPGNLTQCKYRMMTSTPFTADNQGSGTDVLLEEPLGQKVLGVACSTYGTSEYNLEHKTNPKSGNSQYKCICRGKSRYFPNGGPSDGTSRCILHYWICPTAS